MAMEMLFWKQSFIQLKPNSVSEMKLSSQQVQYSEPGQNNLPMFTAHNL